MSLFIIVAALITGLWFLRELGRTPPHKAKQFRQRMMGYAITAIAAYFALQGNFLFALPLFGIGAGLLGWQQVAQKFSNPTSGTAQAPLDAGPMARSEALQVLGLNESASREEIAAVYKRLQRANHPDAGGSTYLAAKINQARDILLKK